MKISGCCVRAVQAVSGDMLMNNRSGLADE